MPQGFGAREPTGGGGLLAPLCRAWLPHASQVREGGGGNGRDEKPPSVPATCELGLGDHMKQSGERMRGGVRSRGRDEKGSGKPESSQLSSSCCLQGGRGERPSELGNGPRGGGGGLGRSGEGVHRAGAGLKSEAVSGSTALGLCGLGRLFCHLDHIAHFSCTNDPRRL